MKKNLLILTLMIFIFSIVSTKIVIPQSTNKAFYFNGIDSKITIPKQLEFKLQTIEAWINIDSTEDSRGTIFTGGKEYSLIISKDSNSYKIHYEVEFDESKFQEWMVYTSKNKLLSSNWYHIAAVDDGHGLQLYINGKIDDKYYDNPQYVEIIKTSSSLIGASYKGIIDEIRLWSVALTEEEIKNWMNRIVTEEHPQWNNLLCYYRCDDSLLRNDSLDVTDSKSNNIGIPYNITSIVSPLTNSFENIINKNEYYKVNPNPATNNVNFSFPETMYKIAYLSIYNSKGLLVNKFTDKELFGRGGIEISVEDLAPGFYYCIIFDGLNINSLKFFIIR